MTDPNRESPGAKTSTSSNDVLEQNVDSLLAKAGEPPRLSDAARSRIRAQLLAGLPARSASAFSVRRFALPGLAAALAVAAALFFWLRGAPAHDPSAPPVATRQLDDGTRVELGDGATLAVTGPRQVRVTGKVLFDVAPGKGRFTVETASGTATALGTRFVVEADGEATLTAVLRGSVALRGQSGDDVVLGAGQGGRVARGQPAQRHAVPRLSHLTSWVKTLRERHETNDPSIPSAPRGTLFARDPNRPGSAESPLPMKQLTVDVVVEHRVARVAIDHTFHNPADAVLEGTYRFSLPPDAALQRFSMYVDGKLNEAAVVERMRARRIYEDLVYVRQVDPALLEYAGLGKLQMRVYPLPPRQDKRIALAYTQTLPRLYDTWTVSVPLPKIDGPVEDVRFALRLSDCANCEVVSPTHQLTTARQGEALELSYAAKGAPVGDSLLVTVRERRGQPDAAVAKEGGDTYLHLRIPVEVPRPAGDAQAARRRRWAILNDVSASRGPLERRAQAELIGALIGELDEEDQVSVLAFDVAVRELLPPTRVLDVDLKRLAEKVATDDAGLGATDAAAGLTAALARLADTGVATGATEAPPAILYLGDGVVTAGPRQLDALRQQIAGKAMFVGVGVGDGADTMTLGALAGATGGMMATIDLSDDLRWRAFDLIATLNTPRITNLSAELRDSAGALLPGALLRSPQLADGEEAELVAKLPPGQPAPARVLLRGTASGAPWQLEVAVPAPAPGLYAPRLWAQREIERMMLAKHEAPAMPACAKEPCPSPAEVREQRDELLRKQIVELGKRHFLLSRHTSLIVLENDAMYAEYGVVQGSGQMWAPYALPRTIPVQKGPAPAPVSEEPATAELWRDAALGLAETTPATLVANFAGESSRKLIRGGSGAGYGTIGTSGAGGVAATTSAAPRDAEPEADEADEDNKAQADRSARGDGWFAVSPREEKTSSSATQMPQPPAPPAPSESRAALADVRGLGVGRARRSYYPGPGLVGYLMPVEMQAMRYVSSATLDDLTELVPAMSRDELTFALDTVRRARGSDEPRPAAPLQATPPAAPVADAAAIARLDRARAALPAGTYRWGDFTLSLDAGRALLWKRTLSNGLEEQASFDGTRLLRRYDELGLAFTNQLAGSDALAVSLAYFPLLLPPADALARDFALAMDGADEVTLTALTADVGQRRPALRLTFDGERLRRISDGRGKVLVELTWTGGALVAAAVASRPHPASFSADPSAASAAMKDAADVAASAGGRVVIELPLRPLAVRTAELERMSPGDPGAPASMAWRFTAHQRLASAAAARSWKDQLALVETLLARGPLFAGERALTAAALRSLSADKRAAAVAGSDDVALYLQRRLLASASSSPSSSGKHGLRRVARVAPPTVQTPAPALPGRGALGSLAVVREVFALVDAGKGNAALLRASALPASARMWRTLAATAIARSAGADVAGLAALWSSLDGELTNLGRYQAALTYLQRGSWRRAELDNATAILSVLLEDIDLQALPPPVDPSLSYWYTQSSRGVAGWHATYARWRDRVLGAGDLRHTLALLRALPYDAPDDLLRILDRAATLAGSDTDQVLSVAVLAASRGQLPWALSFLTPLIDRPGASSELARVASELAQQQGQPAEALRSLQLAIDRDGGGTTADYARLLVLSQQLLLHTSLSQRPALVERATRWATSWRNAEPGGAADQLLAQLLFAAGDAPGAFRVLSSSIDRDPMSGEAWGGIAEQFERAGEVEASLPYWHEAVILDQTNPTWRIRHARALLAVGQKDAARQILTEVSRRRWHPRFEWSAYQAKDLLRTLR